VPPEEMTVAASNQEYSTTQKSFIDVVFSDLDGTLIHYPENIDELERNEEKRHFIKLPPSSTGLKGSLQASNIEYVPSFWRMLFIQLYLWGYVGIISMETMKLCQRIRHSGCKFVLVSGMRTSTLLKRIHYLPKADAYCCEAGGRIFYAVPEPSANCYNVIPKPYPGATKTDLEPFYIVEDLQWRNIMEQTVGKNSFIGNELDADGTYNAVPVKDRDGMLWQHARMLMEMGYILDINGYATCFRVNEKQQKAGVNFNALARGKINYPEVLSTSSNLGCLDFYPANSGKKNWYVVAF
jgi:hypothetical protein